ncbi:YXWGXW repeat-containing protein [Paraburkholderia sp. D15]|uniref:YXWGXW repeat-containing protein n=1 Tax=Paraburkholderia sp. D15 TaxID=2880218 RepID=UPI00247A82C8|nr:YXWGXW repeat-containing protein [Paraburkholderia sp. D15]WGS54860.1 YXWGXW repeat-containing protein [Paraburkholderia sp. D15]
MLGAVAMIVALGGTAALTATPARAQAVIVAPMAPPPPRVEVVPAPRAGYVWDQGRWRWNHGRYVWVPGHWQPVRVGYRWVPGHWVQRGPNWRWVEGHWA